MSYHAGRVAEDRVSALYHAAGLTLAAQRWRGRAGEIDLVFRDGRQLVFVEVKQARTHAIAAERLTGVQMSRILAAAAEFVATEPAGQDSDMRFDVALVDGAGEIELRENALVL